MYKVRCSLRIQWVTKHYNFNKIRSMYDEYYDFFQDPIIIFKVVYLKIVRLTTTIEIFFHLSIYYESFEQ